MNSYTFMVSPISRVTVYAESEAEAQQKIARLTRLPFNSAPPTVTNISHSPKINTLIQTKPTR